VTGISGRLAVGATALAGLVVLTGCGAQHPGAAAFVGSTRISASDLTARVDRGLANPQAKAQLGGDRPAFERRMLTQLIDEKVIQAAAKDEGVTVTQGQVDARLSQYAAQAGGRKQLEQQAAQGGVSPTDLPGFVRDIVLTDAIGDKLVANAPVPQAQLQALYKSNIDQFDQVRSAHILVKDKATADRILAAVKAKPSTFADFARRYSIDTSNKNNGGLLPFTGRSGFVKPFSDAIFAAKPGSFVEVHSQFGWHVVHVLERRTTTLAQATPALRRQALASQRQTLLDKLLTDTAKRLNIRVSPRFGRWNPKTLQVDPPTNSLSTPVPSGGGGASPSG